MLYCEKIIPDSDIPIDHLERVFHDISVSARELGFEHCSYTIQMPVPLSRPIALTFNTLEKGTAGIPGGVDDGVTFHSLQSIYGATSTQLVGSDFGTCNIYGRTFYRWIQTVRALSGAIGQLILIRSRDIASSGEVNIDESKIAWLAKFLHEEMTTTLVKKMLPEALATLTPREKEVLRWSADGKTVPEIGCILTLSKRTVKFHIDNAIVKLNAANKVQAVVKAAAFGLLL